MSIHLNVTGDTADEFLAQFTALAHALGGVSTSAVAAKLVDAGQPVEAPQAAAEGEPAKPVRSRTVKPKEASSAPSSTDASSPPPEDGTAPATDPSSSSGSGTSNVDDTKSSDASSTTPSPETKPLVFDTDVAPKVVEYVQLLGRDAVAGVLSQFGVQKASQLSDPAQWQELLDALADAKA